MLYGCLSASEFQPNIFEDQWWEIQEYPVCFNFHRTGDLLIYEDYIINEGRWGFEEPNIYYVEDEEIKVYYEEECWEIRGYRNLNLTACECLLLPE